MISWTGAACPRCTSAALLILRNLTFSTENHAHFLAVPRMLPQLTATLSITNNVSAITAAAACLWTLTHFSEKVSIQMILGPAI